MEKLDEQRWYQQRVFRRIWAEADAIDPRRSPQRASDLWCAIGLLVRLWHVVGVDTNYHPCRLVWGDAD